MKVLDKIKDLHGNIFTILGINTFEIECPLLSSTNSEIILTKDIISGNTLILHKGDTTYGIMYNVHHKFYFKLDLKVEGYDLSTDIRKGYRNGKKST